MPVLRIDPREARPPDPRRATEHAEALESSPISSQVSGPVGSTRTGKRRQLLGQRNGVLDPVEEQQLVGTHSGSVRHGSDIMWLI